METTKVDYNENIISDELMEFILSNIKIYLGIKELSENATDEQKAEYQFQEKLLKLYINMICKNIIIKTNRNKFPEDLRYLVIDLVKDKFDSNKTDDEIQSIQSMSETGRSVNFGTSNVLSAKLNLIAQKQIDENEKLINRYRLVYKT